MKKSLILLAFLALLCGCSSFKERDTAVNPTLRYRAQRIEIVAKDLIKQGKAASLDEARPLAEKIVDKEFAEQKYASRENETQARFAQDRDTLLNNGN
jgi:hypothetical protein